MTPWLWLKLVHVLAGTFWLGGVAVAALYLASAARALGPAAGPVMKHVISVRRLPVALNIVAILNTLTGFAFYDRLSDHFRHPLVTTFSGMALTVGSVSGVIGFLWGAIVQGPTAAKLGAMTSRLTGPPTPEQAAEIGRLQNRLYANGLIGSAWLVLALVGMALSHPI